MSESADKPLPRPDIHLIEIPCPDSADKSNCYFIDRDPPTLIDTGVATDAAYERLASSLSQRGRSVGDIRRIVLTHGHPDHRALARRISAESGAEVLCHRLEAGRVLNVSKEQEESRHDRARSFFRSMGVPEEELPPLVEGPKSPATYPRLDSAAFIGDGDEIRFDGLNLKVMHTPGHSNGSVCLYEEEAGLLFSGDTILSGSHITPLLEVDMILEDPDYNSLKLHLESLRRLLKLEASHVLPGHGQVFEDYESIVEKLVERHRKRRLHILRALRNGPRPLYQVCRSTFLFTSTDDLYLALSEIMGNMGMLIDEKKVVRTREGDLLYYRKV